MKVTLEGTEIDVNDDLAIIEASKATAARTVRAIPLNLHSRALTELLANLRYWYVKYGATLVLAKLGQHAGIGLESALDAFNFVGKMLGEQDLDLSVFDNMEPEPELITPQGEPLVTPPPSPDEL